jgi:hypothetical protein
MVGASGYLRRWAEIVEAPDPVAATRTHLAAVLTASPECGRLLDLLMSRFRAVRVEASRLRIVFAEGDPDDREEERREALVELSAPYLDPDPLVDLPASVVEVLRHHNGIEWEASGGGYYGFCGLGAHGFLGSGNWEPECLTENDENAELLAGLAAVGLSEDDVDGCCDFGQNWLVWHPIEPNRLGEPSVWFVSHGDCVARRVTKADDLAYGQLLLRVMVQSICGVRVLDKVYN